MEIQTLSCDILCVGGGIAGLMAAIEAADNGKQVIVAEKANTKRSGAAGMGNDHFRCYIPEVHGDYEKFAEEFVLGQMAPKVISLGRDFVDYWFKHTQMVVEKWESWGIPMKYEGEYHFAGHSYPGRPLNHLKYYGKEQKPVLTREALKRGVKIINHCTVFDLLTDDDGTVVGALGLATHEEKLLVFQAKAVMLGTGGATRLYRPPNLLNHNTDLPVSLSGDGRAMAYRAGAELADIEFCWRHAGVKNILRGGQATWVGVLRDRNGNAIGPFLDKPDRLYNDMTTETDKRIFERYQESAKGPIYMSGEGISQEDYEYMVGWLRHEGNGALLEHLEDENIDYSKNPIEFATYNQYLMNGLIYNKRGETNVKGLYAAGDEHAGAISCAAVFGWSAGKHASEYVTTVQANDYDKFDSIVVEKAQKLEAILSRKNGPNWEEANVAVEQIMSDYCGDIRSETTLDAGLENLKRLKRRTHERITASNFHELARCLEVFNILDLAELVMLSAKDRKETRTTAHIRPDYPITNPTLNKMTHYIKKGSNGEPVTEWR